MRTTGKLLSARVWADWHLHDWDDSGRRLREQVAELAAQIEEGADTRPRTAIVAGDLVHRRGLLSPSVLAGLHTLVDLLATQYETVWLLAGNHDHAMKAGRGLHSLLHLRDRHRNVRVVDRGELSEDEGFALVAWFADKAEQVEEIRRLAKKKLDGPAPILVTHVALHGAKADNGWLYEGGMALSDLHPEAWSGILLGDFHRPQIVATHPCPVLYVGSPYQTNFGDDPKLNHGYMDVTLHPETGLSFTRTAGKHPKFLTVESADEAKRAAKAGHYVRLIARETLSSAAERKLREGGVVVQVAPPPPPVARLDVAPDSSAAVVLAAWADDKGFTDGLTDVEREAVATAQQMIAEAGSTGESRVLASGLHIKRVEAENFLSYGTLSVGLEDRGVVLLDGVNLDDDSADSNGAGKSAVIEAVVFALYGETLRGCPVAGVEKTGAKGGTFALVEAVLPDGREVRVVRNRKHKDHPPGLSVSVGGVDISRAKPTETQAALNTLTGIDFRTFQQVACFGQGVTALFSCATDAERKTLLEQLCGAEQFGPLLEAAKVVSADVAASARDAASAESAAVRDMARYDAELGRALEHESREAETRARRVAEAESKVGRLESELVEREARALEQQREGEAAAKAKVRAIDDQLESLEEARVAGGVLTVEEAETALEAVRKRFEVAVGVSAKARTEHMIAGAEVERLDKRRKEAGRIAPDASAVPVCDSCGQRITDDSVKAHAASLTALLNEAMSAALETEAAVHATNDALERVRAEKDKAGAALDMARAHAKMVTVARQDLGLAQTALERARGAAGVMEANLSADRRALTDAREEVARARADKGAWASVVASARVSLEKAQEALALAKAATEEANTLAEVFATVVKLFGPRGLRAFLFDALFPRLAAEANEALAVLSGGELFVEFATETRSDGEKVTFRAGHVGGAESYEALSGGQKRKVDLALCWAISALVSGRCNVLFVDEAFDALDSTAGGRVAELLERRRQSRGTILVTTHRSEYKELFPSVWTATRSNGSSTLREEAV